MANPYETSAIQSFEAAESKSTTDQKLSSEQLKFDRPQSRTGSHYLTGGTMSEVRGGHRPSTDRPKAHVLKVRYWKPI